MTSSNVEGVAVIFERRPPSPRKVVAVTFPPTTMLLSTTRPVVVFVNWRVFEVVFPLSVTAWRVVAMLERRPPSPRKVVAVTFPPTTMLLSTTRPVVVFVNWRVLDDVFPLSVTAWRVVAMLERSPPHLGRLWL